MLIKTNAYMKVYTLLKSHSFENDYGCTETVNEVTVFKSIKEAVDKVRCDVDDWVKTVDANARVGDSDLPFYGNVHIDGEMSNDDGCVNRYSIDYKVQIHEL